MKIFDNYVTFFGAEDFLSNFYPSTITEISKEPKTIFDVNENPIVVFDTGEAYFQSRKAVLVDDWNSYKKLASHITPKEAKRIGRQIKMTNKQIDEWLNIRFRHMCDTIHQKFTQNPKLLKELLSEKYDYKTFIEASPYDKYWGSGHAESEYPDVSNFNNGNNMLGKIITFIRAHMKSGKEYVYILS